MSEDEKSVDYADAVIDEYVVKGKKLKTLYQKVLGRPPIYASPHDMMKMIDQYVSDGCRTKRVPIGKRPNLTYIEMKVMTYSGMALHLGFSSIKQMINYAARNADYADPIAYAKTVITQYYEEKMQEGVSPTAMIFMIHNLTGMSMNSTQAAPDQATKMPTITFRKTGETKIKQLDGARTGSDN